MCHYPSCRKESVLLDYSSDGGLFQAPFVCSLTMLLIFKMTKNKFSCALFLCPPSPSLTLTLALSLFLCHSLSNTHIHKGISWTLLHEMDYLKYLAVRRDYIMLPEAALTNATRLRWWQPFKVSFGLVTPNPDRAQWALDNILIGGSEINPSTLLDTFDEGIKYFECYLFCEVK